MATRTMLEEAKAALHQLVLGKSVVRIQKDGRGVDYTPANRSELEAYIVRLESELSGSVRRPIGFRL